MKHTKRILAIMLAALFLVAMVPTAFAANEKLTLTCDKDQFEFTVYKVATLANTTTGAYTIHATDDNVKGAIATANQTGAQFLSVLNTAYNADHSSVGTAESGVVKKGSSKEITTPGIYYAVVTKEHENKTKVSNAVIVWPEYKNDAWDYGTNGQLTFALGDKVDFGTVTVNKFLPDEAKDADSTNSGMNGEVTFTLKATKVGSTTEHATRYVIWDKMSKGLTYVANSAKVYYDSVDDANAAYNDFTVETESFTASHTKYDATKDADYKDGTYITITAKDDTLSNNAFYGHNYVYVQYRAKINKDANIGTTGNPNKDGLEYNTNGSKDGDTRIVYTCQARIKKVNGVNNAGLQGCVLGLYQGSTKLAEGTSAADGTVKFIVSGTDEYKLAPGDYTIKEESTVTGFLKSSATVDFTISDNDVSTGTINLTETFKNYPVKTPSTGGMGTMIFTIVGGSLIVLAGVMMIVIMRRRRTAK